jgi:hypothetical protein
VTTKGSEFVSTFASKGYAAWEAAAFEAAKSGGVVEWPWAEVTLSDGTNTCIVRVQTDLFSVGTPEDFLRLPLTPSRAQQIGNLTGLLLPTPLLAYRTWQQSQLKLNPVAMVPNKGANLVQFAEHNAAIESQRAGRPGLISGIKKSVVVSNIYKPGKVVIFAWYRPAPDVFDNGKKMGDPERQPLQPLSNVHNADYWDYSHGIHFYHPICLVNGAEMLLTDVMQHPVLWRLVSHEGPVKMPRYPAPNAPPDRAPSVAFVPANAYSVTPTANGLADLGLGKVAEDSRLAALARK